MSCAANLAELRSIFSLIPVSYPSLCNIETKSSVAIFPEAPGAKCQPPNPAIHEANLVMPSSIAALTFDKANNLVS